MAMTHSPGDPCWIELFTPDVEQAREFYGELFGWTAEHGDEEKYGGYIMFSKDGQMVGGCMRNDGSSGAPDVWTVYLASDDAEATTKETETHGSGEGKTPFPVVLFGHGYGSSRFDFLGFAWAFNRMGMAVCAADFPGHGPTIDPDELALIEGFLTLAGLDPFLD